MKINRLAAIDLGSNSVRCIVVEVDRPGKFRVLDDEKATVRLGEGVVKEGAISETAWQRTMDALSRMKKIVDGYGVIGVEAVATSAVRANTERSLTSKDMIRSFSFTERGESMVPASRTATAGSRRSPVPIPARNATGRPATSPST